MKVLMLSQAYQVSDQPDYDKSFRDAKSEGSRVELLNIPFRGFVSKYGSDAFYREVVRANDEFKPDLIFFQFFHSNGLTDPTECVHVIHQSLHHPLVFGSLGDLFDTGVLSFLGRPIPRHTIQLASCADAFFCTSMGGVADCLVRHKARNVVFLPNAFCPMHFPDWDSDDEYEKEYGVVMLCSNGHLLSRFPLRAYNNTFRRRRLVNRLTQYLGKDFCIFGRGWNLGSSRGSIPFKEQMNIYRRGRVVVDAPAPIINSDYYSSDRAFFMLASGVPLVHFHTPRFEKILRPIEHVYYVNNPYEAAQTSEKLLSFTAEQLHERRRKIVAFVKTRHMIDHRIDTIISVAEAIKKARDGRVSPEEALNCVRMWHFLEEVDLRDEYKYAVGNWKG